MRFAKRIDRLPPWVAVLLGLWLCGLPSLALAAEFTPPSRGTPGRREGGGTRDINCVLGNPSLTALSPQTNLGLTTAAYPRFFWFVPKTRAQVEFTLSEKNAETSRWTPIYRTMFKVDRKTAGIASLELPQNANIPPLEVGKDYQWYVEIVCVPRKVGQSASEDLDRTMLVYGTVQRVALNPALADQLAKATPRDRVQLFAKNGLWFDALSALADLRCDAKNTAAISAWTSLLRSVKLDAVAEQPLLQQCKS